ARHRAEMRMRVYGIAAICVAIAVLLSVLVDITISALPAFKTSEITVSVTLDAEALGVKNANNPKEIAALSPRKMTRLIRAELLQLFPQADNRKDRNALMQLFSAQSGLELRDWLRDNPHALGKTQQFSFAASDDADLLITGNIDRNTPENTRRLSDKQIGWVDQMQSLGMISQRWNWRFLTNADSRNPEQAGILGAVIGSFWLLLITATLSLPLGVMSAIYLEEIAKKNRLTDFLEVNINNLAAVPSIIFGLLGLALFLNIFGLPRSAPLTGGIVLSLMTLPTIIISSRAALRSVPASIRHAALAMGASPIQVIIHHVLPLAMPGIMTGSIIGLAQALGETAPLLLIGMVAF
ncbi:MAG: DUF3333 domain-containing protein, partial [Pseudomonadota bacterium]